MSSTVRHLAALVGGEVVGDRDLAIDSARSLQDAAAGDITFLHDAGELETLNRCNAGAALVDVSLPTCTKALIRVKDPARAFALIVQHLKNQPADGLTGIHPQAVVHASARIGSDTAIDRFAVIGADAVIGARCRIGAGAAIGKNCRLGDDVVVHEHAVLYDDTVVGDRVTLHARATIGADGFGYRFQGGRHVKVPQLGNVEIGADVEIGAGAAIDRGTFGSTSIGAGTKVGNLSQIAHNCRIGLHSLLANQVGVGGSSSIGDHLVVGDQAGIKDHMEIGAGVVLGPCTGVVQPVSPGRRMFLYPAEEEPDAERIIACLRELPHLHEELTRVLNLLGLSELAGRASDG